MSEATPAPAPIVVLARDLLISSRITSTARRLGVSVKLLRDPAALLGDTEARLLIVDLDLEGSIAAAVGWARASGHSAAGFVQHVHAERIREAHQAGIKPIFPRSRLESALPELLGPFVR